MNSQIVLGLLEKNACFYGGFVRDYLIRGESFKDIDYYFSDGFICPQEKTINILNYGDIFFACVYERDKYLFGKKYHFFHRQFYYDLSCNLFGFDKHGFFPLPSQHPTFDLEIAWEGVLNKSFFVLSEGRLTTNKMLDKGWKLAGKTIDYNKKISEKNRTGAWQQYNDIAFQRIKDIDKK